MCGIFGYYDLQQTLPLPVLRKSLEVIAHRGPNAASHLHENNLFLGHVRLAIIDLDPRSNQPFRDEANQIDLVFNGEIYNYRELKEDLTGTYNFRTTSDTEVIIAAYLKWGPECFERFRGMFAIALHDRRRRSLVLARDQVGKKPLFLFRKGSTFSFSSEIKAFYHLPAFPNKISKEGLDFYLAYGYTPAKTTFFENVEKLLPGHFLTFDLTTGKTEGSRAFYELPFTPEANRPRLSEETLLAELKNQINEAIKLRLRSDVPVGTFLSGGVDSSLLTIMAKVELGYNLEAFTISFPDSGIDESACAKKITERYGIRHNIVPVTDNFRGLLDKIIPALDEPFADSSFVPTYFVSGEAAKHFRVILSGDGGDELFCGYEHYRYFQLEEKLRRTLGPLAAPTGAIAHALLPDRHKTQILKRLRFGKNFIRAQAEYYQRFFNREERQTLLRFEPGDAPLSFVERNLSIGTPWEESLCYFDFRNYMVDDILVKVDRMSMLHGLEVRSPLLDLRLAEFAFNRLPFALKNKDQVLKHPLKTLLRRYLGNDYDFSRKQGFGVPLGTWFKGPLSDDLLDLCSGQELFERSYVSRLVREHRLGPSNHSKKLFALYVFLRWQSATGAKI